VLHGKPGACEFSFPTILGAAVRDSCTTSGACELSLPTGSGQLHVSINSFAWESESVQQLRERALVTDL
jgi:hypothetical protein